MRSRLIDTLSKMFLNFLGRRFGLNILGLEPLTIKGRERRESVMLECILLFSGFAVKPLPSLQVACLAFRLLWELSGFLIQGSRRVDSGVEAGYSDGDLSG